MTYKEQFIVDDRGRRVKVLLDIEDYEKMLEQLDELESIRIYDEAKGAREEVIPFDEAIREIEKSRE